MSGELVVFAGFSELEKKKSGKGSLAKTYGVRRSGLVAQPSPNITTTYYSATSLKGGWHTYEGKVVVRDGKTGGIVSASNKEPEKSN